MRSSGRPVPAPSSTGRPEFPREARLRRHDAHLDGPWDVSGLCRSTPKAVPARAKGRCEMMPDPTPPYRVRDFCPDCREKFLAVVGWIAPALEATLSRAPPVSAAEGRPAGGGGGKGRGRAAPPRRGKGGPRA